MKKVYVKPIIEVVELRSEELIGGCSLHFTNNKSEEYDCNKPRWSGNEGS